MRPLAHNSSIMARAGNAGIPYVVVILTLLLLLPLDSRAQTKDSEQRMFSLSVQEHRREERTSLRGSGPMWIEFESEQILFGRLDTEVRGDSIVFTTFNDSMQFKSVLPYLFETFMSRDTLYYSSDARRNVTSGGFLEMYDSMLACVFEGPVMRIHRCDSCAGTSLTHLKEDCESGEYTRLDLPYALGLFFTNTWVPSLTEDSRWLEKISVPPYSRLGYRPAVLAQARIVQIKDGVATAVVSSDTSLSNVNTVLPNGETATIIQDAVHLGGTLFLSQETGLPLKGEIRIEETMQILRPKLSDRSIEKECAYILRFRLY